MKEDLLHFIWKYKKLQLGQLATAKNERIVIKDVGSHNLLAGPDFFNAKIVIDGQLWAGNVEIHVKSSDWYAHNHEQDRNYNNVILHVVWEDDTNVYRSDNSEIPTLALQDYIPSKLLKAYQDLFDNKNFAFINCEKNIANVDDFLIENWLERLYFERLEQKTVSIDQLLDKSKNDWENVLFSMLLKNFGLKINGEAFSSLAKNLDFSIVRKIRSDKIQLESVLFGLSDLLDNDQIFDEYYLRLQKEYGYLKKKFALSPDGVQKPHFFKLRPPNFPTIRLSQLADLYSAHPALFIKIMEAKSLKDLYSIFEVSASEYWDNRYTFGKESKRIKKRLTKKFVDLLVVNTILPLKFCYAKHLGKDVNEEIDAIATQIASEENSIIQNFSRLCVVSKNAKDSQSILQLYNEYCTKNKCLQCAVGNHLLNGNS